MVNEDDNDTNKDSTVSQTPVPEPVTPAEPPVSSVPEPLSGDTVSETPAAPYLDAGATPNVFADGSAFRFLSDAPVNPRDKISPVVKVTWEGEYVTYHQKDGSRVNVYWRHALIRLQHVRKMIAKDNFEAKWEEIDRNQWLTEETLKAVIEIRKKLKLPVNTRAIRQFQQGLKADAKGFRHRK